tara:strand:+ start:368 stop:487 length:120 start_codon:yes stop_codon:yes gene_type:complete
MSVTKLTFQPEMSTLKAVTPLNIIAMVVTELVSQAEMFA